MSERDAPWHEMLGFDLPGWPGREPAEQLLDAILARQPLPPDAPRGLQVVAEQLAGLASPAGPGRLPGEAAAVAAFSRAVSSGGPCPHRGSADRTRRLVLPRRRGLPATGRARLAAALAVAGLVMGTTAAAYAGALPASMQAIAHHIIDAPAARRCASSRARAAASPVTRAAAVTAGAGSAEGSLASARQGEGARQGQAARPAAQAKPSQPRRPSTPKGKPARLAQLGEAGDA